jgi:O-antigen ligase
MDSKSTKTTLLSTVFTTVLVSVYGVLQHFGIDDDTWVQDVKNRIFSTLGQPNWLAAYLSAFIFLPTSLLLSKIFSHPSQNYQRFKLKFQLNHDNSWVVIFFLVFLTLLYTKSRSGLLGFGLGALVYLFLVYKSYAKELKTNIGLILLSLVLLVTITLSVSNPIRDLFIKSSPQATSGPVLESGGTESGKIRQIVWAGSLKIWLANAKNFLIGTGPETFAQSYYQFRPVEHNKTSEWEFLYNKAHNEYLNFLSTTGVIGLLAYLFLLYSIIRLFSSQIFPIPAHHKEIDSHLVSIALFSGWTTILVTNFWGFSVVVMQICLFLLPTISLSLNHTYSLPPRTTPTTQAKLGILVITILALVLTYQLSKYWLADFHYAQADKAMRIFSQTQNPQDILHAYEEASSAYQLSPHEPVIALELADVASYMAVLTSDNPETSAQLVDLSYSSSNAAINISPYHPSYYKTQARVFILLSAIQEGYLDKADQALAKAESLSPTDPRIPYNRCVIAKYQNNIPKALEYINKALVLKPDFPEAQKQLEEIATMSSKKK